MKKTRRVSMSLLNIKVTDRDKKLLVRAAEKYARGNLSEWLRFAGMTFRPKKTQVAA